MTGQTDYLRVGVIMAGGSGERFWPLSRKDRPKQLLRLTSPSHSMLEEAVARLAAVVPRERIIVVTGRHLVDPIRRGATGLPEGNIIAEPAKRNTSGALAYAAAHFLSRFPGDAGRLSMAVTTADHLIGDDDRFTCTLEAALDAAERAEALVTIGVIPTRPETGYGYIEVTPGTPPLDDSPHGVPVYPVAAFREKPNREQAEDFLASGRHFWNSGMFFWRMTTFLDQLARARPVLAQAVHDLAGALRAGEPARVQALFESLEDISIDYALMERAAHVLLARADFPWDDVGSWPSLDRTLPRDNAGNVLHGDPVVVDARDCIVYNEAGPDAMAVAVIGVEGLAVVVTPDGVLVIPKDRAQDVRHAVQALKQRNAPQL